MRAQVNFAPSNLHKQQRGHNNLCHFTMLHAKFYTKHLGRDAWKQLTRGMPIHAKNAAFRDNLVVRNMHAQALHKNTITLPQNKTKQNKTKQNKTKQNKTKQTKKDHKRKQKNYLHHQINPTKHRTEPKASERTINTKCKTQKPPGHKKKHRTTQHARRYTASPL